MLDDNKQDLPNFAAWSNKNLADFATESYIRMQKQQESIEQAQQDLKDAMSELRKLVIKQS
jgi:hypothetical protein